MSSIGLPTSLNNARIDTYTRTDGSDTVHVQAVIPANPYTETTGTLAAATQTVAVTGLVDADGVLVTTSGTFSGTLAFEASTNGTDWYAVFMTRASSSTSESSRALTGTTLEGWRANIAGWSQFRVRCSAYTSGTANIRIIPVSLPFEPSVGVTGTVAVSSITAGTTAIGDVGVQYRANATGAASVSSVLSPATPAVGTVKASAGRLLGWQLQNSSTGVRSVKLFNATAPTLGTTSAVFEIDIPAGGRSEIQLPGGIGFATAITWSATSAKGLTDNTATGLAANDVSGSFFFA